MNIPWRKRIVEGWSELSGRLSLLFPLLTRRLSIFRVKGMKWLVLYLLSIRASKQFFQKQCKTANLLSVIRVLTIILNKASKVSIEKPRFHPSFWTLTWMLKQKCMKIQYFLVVLDMIRVKEEHCQKTS